MKRICVFCGSSPGARPEYAAAARRVGEIVAARGMTLVYGGGCVGLMGALADAALAAGGEVIGVIPEAMLPWEVGHTGLTELRVVRTMHERKALMADLADGFVALPGGFGTLEELCEVLTWSQLSFHTKPCGLLNVAGYFDPLVAMFDHATAEEFVRPVHRALVLASSDPEELLAQMERHRAPEQVKWIEKDER